MHISFSSGLVNGHFVKGFSSFTCFQNSPWSSCIDQSGSRTEIIHLNVVHMHMKNVQCNILSTFYCANMTLHELVACSQMMFTFTRLCVCVCVWSPHFQGEFHHISGLQSKCHPVLKDNSSLHQQGAPAPTLILQKCHGIHPPWHYTREKGLYLHMKTLAIKYPTQPCVELSVCLALNGPLLLLLSVICLCITHCWSQSLIDSLCLVCMVNCKRLFT